MVLALVDFIPNMAFALGVYFLIRLIRYECGKSCAALTLTGSLLVFLGGILKAIWKLLSMTMTPMANVSSLTEIQFALMASGFLLMLIGVVWLNRRGSQFAPAATMLPWKIPLLVTMVLSSMGMYSTLIYMSLRRQTKWAAFGFMVALLSVLAMGGLTAGDQTIARQWVAECVNSIGQSCFALGCYLLYRVSIKSRREGGENGKIQDRNT